MKVFRAGCPRGHESLCDNSALFIYQPAIRIVSTSFLAIDHDDFRRAASGGQHVLQDAIVRHVVTRSQRIDQHFHAASANQAVIPAVVVVELKREQLDRATRQQSQRAAFDLGLDATAAECADLRAIGEHEHRRPRLLRCGTACLDEGRVADGPTVSQSDVEFLDEREHVGVIRVAELRDKGNGGRGEMKSQP